MAIAQMKKVMILSHRSEVAELLEVLQGEGICQILKTEEAIVSKDFPDLTAAIEKPRDIEQLVSRLEKSIAFLQHYFKTPGGLTSILAPRMVIDEKSYKKVISDGKVIELLEASEKNKSETEKLNSEIENLQNRLNELAPWHELMTPVEELTHLERAACLVGFLPSQNFEKTAKQLKESGAVMQLVGSTGYKNACIIVCLAKIAEEVQKLLRSADFESFSFGDMTGTVAEDIADIRTRLNDLNDRLDGNIEKARQLAENLPNLKILQDYYSNLLNREQTHSECPATEQAVVLEGWTKKKDYARLAELVSKFGASSLHEIQPEKNEEPPVEIENKRSIRPFEAITRLYGMPQYNNIDPTFFLAPFFILFFALCLTDAGCGLIMIATVIYLLTKIQGDKKFMWMMLACSVATIITGALTGGWFGDAMQQFVPGLKPIRERMLWFDPFEKPLTFFMLSLVLGYIQIIFGITIAFVHNLLRKDYISAACDQLTWLVMLNSIALFGLSKAGVLPIVIGKFFGPLALVPAVAIIFCSEREGGWGARIGMGAYNLFSTIFFMGDILSYVRLMALGMVTAGFAMAINVITKIVLDVPYAGIIFAIIVFIGGHIFNTAMSVLSAFVHTLRLQFVEFFPKFFVGGGRNFEPLSKQYKHIQINKV